MHIDPQIIEAQVQGARVQIQPGFAWDEQQAYLFDIDGTLLRNRDRIHYESFARGVLEVTGYDIAPVLFLTPGGTDPAILRDALAKADIPSEATESQRGAILEAICRCCGSAGMRWRYRIMPGVEETLGHLARKGALLGVATGNLEAIGWIKIEEAGLREWFRFGGFSDHFPIRAELVANAARKARELAGAIASLRGRRYSARHRGGARQRPGSDCRGYGQIQLRRAARARPEVCATSLADLLAHDKEMP